MTADGGPDLGDSGSRSLSLFPPLCCLFISHPKVEGSHGTDGLLLGRPQEEPDQHFADKSLLEIVDGIVMMYNLSVHQQLGKVSCCRENSWSDSVTWCGAVHRLVRGCEIVFSTTVFWLAGLHSVFIVQRVV